MGILRESLMSILGLLDRLHLFHGEEFLVMVIEGLGQGDPLCHRRCEIKLILQLLLPALPLLNVLFHLILNKLRTIYLIVELVDEQYLVFLLLAHLALQVHLLDPLSSIVDFLLDSHALVEGGLTL